MTELKLKMYIFQLRNKKIFNLMVEEDFVTKNYKKSEKSAIFRDIYLFFIRS